MKQEQVSVITPMYNAEKYIAETIESVQAQTYRNWEMIIVDDVSTDGSARIVKRYAEEDNRIKYIRHECNKGVAQARNTALKAAEGRYVAFLDSDDLWVDVKLERQLQFMQEYDVTFSYTACGIIDEKGILTGKVRHVPDMRTYRTLLRGNPIPCLTVVLDRNKVKDFQMPTVPHEDYAAWLKILNEGIRAYGINEVLAEYRVSGKSLSGNKIHAAKWTWDIYRSQPGIGIIQCCYYFLWYMWNAVRRRI